MGIEGGMLVGGLGRVFEGFVCVLGDGRTLNWGSQGELRELERMSVRERVECRRGLSVGVVVMMASRECKKLFSFQNLNLFSFPIPNNFRFF